MKKVVFNLGAIIAAFLIGIAINSACADNLENKTDIELRNLVSQLQQEVNSLKNRVAELEKKVADSGGSNGGSSPSLSFGFDVNGLHFDNAGYVEARIKQTNVDTYSYYIIDGVKTEPKIDARGYVYTYDDYGRIIQFSQDMISSISTTNYSYSGKSVTIEQTTKYIEPVAGSIQESYSRYTTIYQ